MNPNIQLTHLFLDENNKPSDFLTKEVLGGLWQDFQECVEGFTCDPPLLDLQDTPEHVIVTLRGRGTGPRSFDTIGDKIGEHAWENYNRAAWEAACSDRLGVYNLPGSEVADREWKRSQSAEGGWYQYKNPRPKLDLRTRQWEMAGEVRVAIPKRGGPQYQQAVLRDEGGWVEGQVVGLEYRPAFGIRKVKSETGGGRGVAFYGWDLLPSPTPASKGCGHLVHTFWGTEGEAEALWEAVRCSRTGAEPLELARRLRMNLVEGFTPWNSSHMMGLPTLFSVQTGLANLSKVISRKFYEELGSGMRGCVGLSGRGGALTIQTPYALGGRLVNLELRYDFPSGWTFRAVYGEERGTPTRVFQGGVPHPCFKRIGTREGAAAYWEEHGGPLLKTFLNSHR